jgi:hypothetical protein
LVNNPCILSTARHAATDRNKVPQRYRIVSLKHVWKISAQISYAYGDRGHRQQREQAANGQGWRSGKVQGSSEIDRNRFADDVFYDVRLCLTTRGAAQRRGAPPPPSANFLNDTGLLA